MKKYYHPRIEQILTKMYLQQLQYYVLFYGFVDFYEHEPVGTMGVGLHRLNMVFMYNEKFLMRHNDPQLTYLMIHELYHLLFKHPARTGGRNPELANVAKDMVINHLIDTHYCGPRSWYDTEKKETVTLPPCAERPVITQEDIDKLTPEQLASNPNIKVGAPIGCFLPAEYLELVKNGEARLVWEEVYEWLLKTGRAKIHQVAFDSHGDGKPMSDAEKQVMAQLVEEATEKAKARASSAGSMPGHLKELLELDLKRPRGNNLKSISRLAASLRGTVKDPSYRRRNRKVEEVKGHKRVGHVLTVLHDWSGSMYGRHEAVVRELFREGYEYHFVGADTQVGNHFKVTRKEQLKKIPFNGGGGTILQPGVDFIKQNAPYKRNPLVILTDGELGDDCLDFTGFPHKVLIITTNLECKVRGGNVRQIKVEINE